MNVSIWILLTFFQARHHLSVAAAIDRFPEVEEEKESSLSIRRSDDETQALEVTASVAFTILIQDGQVNDDIGWESYEPQLVWSVDILALEIVALMNRDWGRQMAESTISSMSDARWLSVRIDIPSSIKRLPSREQEACLLPDEVMEDVRPQDRCENVYATMQLRLDNGEDPISTETSFEEIFTAAIGHGRLQSILEDSFPDSFVRIVSNMKSLPPSTSDKDNSTNVFDVPQSDDDGDDDDSFWDSFTQRTTQNKDKEGLLLGGILGIVAGALCALGLSIVYFVVVRQRRRRADYRFKDEKNNIEEIPYQETDLVDTFSAAGLEWGSPHSQDSMIGCATKTFSSVSEEPYSMEALSHVEPLTYRRPSRGSYGKPSSPQSDITTNSERNTSSLENYSDGSGDGDLGLSRVVDFAGDIQPSQESSFAADNKVTIHFDNLERAIVEGDWETLGAVASTMASITSEISDPHQTSTSSSTCSPLNQDWIHRDKTWQDMMDVTKAAELDRLIEDGDWKGIMEAAQRYGREWRE